jgi:hypothetical protein
MTLLPPIDNLFRPDRQGEMVLSPRALTAPLALAAIAPQRQMSRSGALL